jgi:hypothetical protein
LKRKAQDDGDTPRSTGTLSGSHSGQATLRREQWLWWREVTTEREKKLNNLKEDETKCSVRKRNSDMPVGYLGQTALRREQCDRYAHF